MLTFDKRICMILDQDFKQIPALISCKINEDIKLALFNLCKNCKQNFADMSTVGHGAFAACKVRENRQKTLQRMHAMGEEKAKMYNVNYNMETPMKYSSKLMNSIWGMYNRYSVHNLKKFMDDVTPVVAAGQQTSSVGSAATLTSERSYGEAKTGSKTPAKQLLPNFWAPSEYSC